MCLAAGGNRIVFFIIIISFFRRESFIIVCSASLSIAEQKILFFLRQQREDKLTQLLTLTGFRASRWTDLSPQFCWCQVNDGHQELTFTTRWQFIVLLFVFMSTLVATSNSELERRILFWTSAFVRIWKLLIPLQFQSWSLRDDFMQKQSLLMDRSIVWWQWIHINGAVMWEGVWVQSSCETNSISNNVSKMTSGVTWQAQ